MRELTYWSTVLSKASIIALLIAILPLPYEYYLLLRIFIFITSILFVYSHDQDSNWKIIYIIIAFVFNPLLPLHLNKFLWIIIDILTAVTIYYSLKKDPHLHD